MSRDCRRRAEKYWTLDSTDSERSSPVIDLFKSTWGKGGEPAAGGVHIEATAI